MSITNGTLGAGVGAKGAGFQVDGVDYQTKRVIPCLVYRRWGLDPDDAASVASKLTRIQWFRKNSFGVIRYLDWIEGIVL
jgi:hypothetical protein